MWPLSVVHIFLGMGSKKEHPRSQHSTRPRWKLQGFSRPIFGNHSLSPPPYLTGYSVRTESRGEDYKRA